MKVYLSLERIRPTRITHSLIKFSYSNQQELTRHIFSIPKHYLSYKARAIRFGFVHRLMPTQENHGFNPVKFMMHKKTPAEQEFKEII